MVSTLSCPPESISTFGDRGMASVGRFLAGLRLPSSDAPVSAEKLKKEKRKSG